MAQPKYSEMGKGTRKPRAPKAPKPPEPPQPKVSVSDTREITVTFSLEGIEAALIEAARQQAEADAQDGKPTPDDPIFQGVELDLSADRDGDDVSLNGATVTFKFRP